SDKPDGTWRTTVSVVTDPALSPWQYVWLDMAVEPRADTQQSDQPLRLDIMPPEAARMLLDEIDAYDGTYPLSPVPRIVRGRDEALVDTLVAAIHDPKRRLAVVATGARPRGAPRCRRPRLAHSHDTRAVPTHRHVRRLRAGRHRTRTGRITPAPRTGHPRRRCAHVLTPDRSRRDR